MELGKCSLCKATIIAGAKYGEDEDGNLYCIKCLGTEVPIQNIRKLNWFERNLH